MASNEVKLNLGALVVNYPACPVSFCLYHVHLRETNILFFVNGLNYCEIGEKFRVFRSESNIRVLWELIINFEA